MVKTDLLKARIVGRGLQYQDVAKALDIDYSTFNLKIGNKRRIYMDEVADLCNFLEIHTLEEFKYYFNVDFLF